MKKKVRNKMTLEFDALSRNESFARQAVCSFAAGLDPTLEELSDLRIIVSEGVTNCIVHAYKNRSRGTVHISVVLYEDRSLKLKIRDRGCGIADIEKSMEPLYTTDPEGERGGMGLPIIKSLSDKMTILSKVGRGTTLSVVKSFHIPGNNHD